MKTKDRKLELKNSQQKRAKTKFFGITSIILNIIGLLVALTSISAIILAPSFSTDTLTWSVALLLYILIFVFSGIGAIVFFGFGLGFFITQFSFNRLPISWAALGVLIISWAGSIAVYTAAVIISISYPIGG